MPRAKKELETENTSITKSRRMTSLEEFAIMNDLRPEIVAGLKVWLKGDLFHFDLEWERLLKEYMER